MISPLKRFRFRPRWITNGPFHIRKKQNGQIEMYLAEDHCLPAHEDRQERLFKTFLVLGAAGRAGRFPAHRFPQRGLSHGFFLGALFLFLHPANFGH
jgi:hypothetical protein